MKRIFTLLAFLVVCTAAFSQATVTLECYSCEELSGRYCASCQDSEVNYFKGLLVRTPQGAFEINSPFSVLVRGSSVRLTDWQGDIVAFARRDTPYRNMEELMGVINGCNCQGGGSLTPGSVDTDELADGAVTYDKLDQAVKDSISAGGNGLPDGDYGDVTISGSGTAISINNDAVGADELAATTVTAGSYTNGNFTVDADGRITAASNGDAVVADVVSVTFDGGRDTLNCASEAKRIFQVNMGSITRTDTVDIIGSVTGGEYLVHLTNITTDTITWPDNLHTFAGDTLKTKQYTSSTVNGFSFYDDGTNFYTLAATGNDATLPTAPPSYTDTIQLLDDLILYVRGDSITGLSDGNALTTWTDLSPAGNDLAERLGNTSRRPTYRTSQINGKPAVDFINSTDGNEDALANSAEITVNDSITVFLVYSMDGSSNTEFVFYTVEDAFTNFLNRYHYDTSGDLNIAMRDNSPASQNNIYSDTRSTSWKLASITFQAGAVAGLRINGSAVSTGTSNVAATAYAGAMRLNLGAAVNITGSTTVNEADVRIFLAAVVNRALSPSEILDVETFINNAVSIY